VIAIKMKAKLTSCMAVNLVFYVPQKKNQQKLSTVFEDLLAYTVSELYITEVSVTPTFQFSATAMLFLLMVGNYKVQGWGGL
jgi:hypothetical protein